MIQKYEQCGFTIEKCIRKIDGMSNSVDPDQTAPKIYTVCQDL